MNNLANLRNSHPTLHYQKADLAWVGANLELTFEYLIEPDLKFQHKLTFLDLPESARLISSTVLRKYAEHLGLAEALNYWKLTASPEISNYVFELDQKQSEFWQELLIGGMGEYFYVNQIDFTAPDFVKFLNSVDPTKVLTQETAQEVSDSQASNSKVLIPIGGGKDSIVTLEILKQNLESEDLGVLLVNPTQAARDIAELSSLKKIEVKRQLDPKLLELNQQGYLNGHVPISSILAFIGVLAAKLNGFTTVAFSNERSSNEGNVEFHGQVINHQFSKSFQFENNFRKYQENLHGVSSISYLSYLRPLFEVQIAEKFAKMNSYHSIFRSCNRGQKTNSWCGECPKCLFAFMLLYPFVPEQKLTEYFGKNLFEDENLYSLLLALIGKDAAKPFECVGTYEESLATLHLGVESALKQRSTLPILLSKAQAEILNHEENMPERTKQILESWNPQHFLPEDWQDWLKKQ
jgi:hypothetical protein